MGHLRTVLLCGGVVLHSVAAQSTGACNISSTFQTPEQKICEGGKGVFLPALGTEHTWNKGLQICLYLIALLYSFAGVALLADAFMASIEVITSKEIVKQKGDKQLVRVLVWNPTVANLTLMVQYTTLIFDDITKYVTLMTHLQCIYAVESLYE